MRANLSKHDASSRFENLDSEKYLLGAILSDQGWPAVKATGITPFEFENARIRKAFSIAENLDAKGEQVNLITIEEAGQFEPGWDIEIADPDAFPIRPAVIEYHRENLRDCYLRRRTRNLLTDLEAGNITLDAVLADVQKMKSLATEGPSLGNDLESRRIRLCNPPAKPKPILTIAGNLISTSGNLTVISGPVKVGKSGVISALQSAFLSADSDTDADTFGFIAEPSNGAAIITLDTEQSPYDAWCLSRRAADRAGIKELPENYRAYHLNDVPTHERRRMLALEMEAARKACGRVHAVILDGGADLIESVLDETVAITFVDELIGLAVRYDCPLIVVLHENPGSLIGKTRGHFGSQLERKAESNLRIEKDSSGQSVMWSEKLRKGHIPKADGPRFQWCDKLKMHVTVARDKNAGFNAKRDELKPSAEAVFENAIGALKYSEIIKRIEGVCRAKGNTCERRLKEFTKHELVTKTEAGYVLSR
jgi:hypothetical protein